MHAEIRADTMACPVRVVQAALPQRRPSKAIQLMAGGPMGEDGRRKANVPLEHAREGVDQILRRGAKVHRARHVGGSVEVLAPRVAQQHLIDRELAVRLRRGSVVRDGSIRAGASDGRERKANVLVLGPAQRVNFLRRGALRHVISSRHRRLEPGEEARHSNRVPLVRRLHARLLRLVLDGLGQRYRRKLLQRSRGAVGLSDSVIHTPAGPARVDPALGVLRDAGQRLAEELVRVHCDARILEVLCHVRRRDLRSVDEEMGLRGSHDSVRSETRHVLRVLTPEVVEPRNVIEGRDDERARALLLHARAHFRELVLHLLASVLQRMHCHRTVGLRLPLLVVPQRIQDVLRQRHEFVALGAALHVVVEVLLHRAPLREREGERVQANLQRSGPEGCCKVLAN
mmetsp:Transcript_29000/g.68761  ORF Transcript_29000/g.68761 Transcript_29000/m.68761 type:complete len:400 (+) Transcript_29000:792-1991(+)